MLKSLQVKKKKALKLPFSPLPGTQVYLFYLLLLLTQTSRIPFLSLSSANPDFRG